MLIRDVAEDPALSPASLSVLIPLLTSDDPVTVMKAVREMRILADMVEMTVMPLLMAMPGMTVSRAAAVSGRGGDWVKKHYDWSSSSSGTRPPSPRRSGGPSRS